MENPFCLNDESAYQAWRARKLEGYPRDPGALTVDATGYGPLTKEHKSRLGRVLAKTNMALLRGPAERATKANLLAVAEQLGLRHPDSNPCADEDAVSALTVSRQRSGQDYIPYTNRTLSWHTDGYYNETLRQVRAWMLWCQSQGESGGTNQLLDHEILYLLMRDTEPAMVAGLMLADAMTIPANVQQGKELRPARSGPVFSVDAADCLHMRYSARATNIVWNDDARIARARAFMERLFSSGSPYIFEHRLSPGECLISNNVLHNRSAFLDSERNTRLIYRARYFDRVHTSTDCTPGGTTHAETE
jgi:alpha-ketoglutarate-dependent taurine dioxygenase